MRSSITGRCRLLTAVPTGLLVVAVLAAAPPAPAADDPAEEEGERVAMRKALRILWTGDPAAKREIAESASNSFWPLFGTGPEDGDEEARRALGSLISLIRTERDDFITYRLLRELAFYDIENLTPLYLEALKSRSPNLQWAGVEWLAAHKNPDALSELEDAWRHEERPWVRATLMLALVKQGSREYSGDFLELARGKDVRLATAAIRALTALGDPEVIPFLAKIARGSSSNAGLLALDALARWPGSPDALAEVLEATRSPRVDFQRHAVAALGRFDDPAAAARAYELASGRAEASVRAAALGALKGTDPAVLVPLALRILRETPTQENAPAQSAAIGTLFVIDDPAVLPQLAGLAFGDGDPRSRGLFFLKRNLGRAREEPPAGAQPERPRPLNDDGDPILPRDQPEELEIVPPPAMLTVRCWRYPDVPGDPRNFPRLRAGQEVTIEDHFEREHESWVRIDDQECWIPARFIEQPTGSPAAGDKEKSMLIRREFDIPAGEAESDVAQGLIDAGLLEVIEPGDEVVGVAITLDPGDFDQVLLLARSCGLNRTLLDAEIDALVRKLARLYPERPVLDRFRREPAASPSDTDEVIDLDLEELTDR